MRRWNWFESVSGGSLVVLVEFQREFSIRGLGAALGTLTIGRREAGDPVFRVGFATKGSHQDNVMRVKCVTHVIFYSGEAVSTECRNQPWVRIPPLPPSSWGGASDVGGSPAGLLGRAGFSCVGN